MPLFCSCTRIRNTHDTLAVQTDRTRWLIKLLDALISRALFPIAVELYPV